MRRDRNNSILLLLALLLSVFAPEEVECARVFLANGSPSTLQVNCVYALCPTEELEWQASARTDSGTEVCSANASDGLDEVFYPACFAGAAGRSLSDPPPVLVAEAPDLEALLLGEVIACSLESRGPPPLHLPHCPPSLRAPPIA